MTVIAIGPGPTMDEAMDEVRRVGVLVGGETAAKFARELREVAAALPEGKNHGPRGCAWPREAARLKLACGIALIAHRNREGLAGAKALAAKLEELASKSLSAEAQLEVLTIHRELVSAVREEAEQVRLEQKAAGNDPLETLDEAVANLTTGSSSPLDDALSQLVGL